MNELLRQLYTNVLGAAIGITPVVLLILIDIESSSVPVWTLAAMIGLTLMVLVHEWWFGMVELADEIPRSGFLGAASILVNIAIVCSLLFLPISLAWDMVLKNTPSNPGDFLRPFVVVLTIQVVLDFVDNLLQGNPEGILVNVWFNIVAAALYVGWFFVNAGGLELKIVVPVLIFVYILEIVGYHIGRVYLKPENRIGKIQPE